MSRIKFSFLLLAASALLAGCNAAPAAPSPTPSPLASPSATLLPTETPLPSATPTPLAPLVIFLAPEGADAELAGQIKPLVYNAATQAGLRWQERAELTVAGLPPELSLLVALPGVADLSALAAAAPQAQFLAVGYDDLPPVPNLSAVSLQGASPAQQGFMAGFIAALITPDARVAMFGLAEDEASRAARAGFDTGITYYCGLCQPNYPPFYDYPYHIELPAGAQSGEWRAQADFLIDHGVQTVFVYPGAGEDSVLQYLAERGVNLIGLESPPVGLEARWAATLRSDPLPVVTRLLGELMTGAGGQMPATPFVIAQVNAELLTPGRQRFAEQTLADLLAGFITAGEDEK